MSKKFFEFIDSAYVILQNNILEILTGLVIFLVLFFLRKKISNWISTLLSLPFRKNEEIANGIRDAFRGPLRLLILALGLYWGIGAVHLPADAWVLISKIFRITVILIIAWCLANFMPVTSALIMKVDSTKVGRPNAAATVFLSNVLKFIIFAIATVIVISELGYNVNGIVTGLGLGGLTFSLAAKNSAANLFGGFEIITDKPFDVGDWITTSSVDGVVEDITMRSTRIRTAADTVIVIPNASLVDDSITNWSKMNKRLVKFSIGLSYDTSSKTLKDCIKKIEKMIRNHSEIDQEKINVSFNKFTPQCLEIGIVYFTKTKEYDEYLKVKEDINFKIKEIVENENAKFAVPSTGIIQNQNNTQNQNENVT